MLELLDVGVTETQETGPQGHLGSAKIEIEWQDLIIVSREEVKFYPNVKISPEMLGNAGPSIIPQMP